MQISFYESESIIYLLNWFFTTWYAFCLLFFEKKVNEKDK